MPKKILIVDDEPHIVTSLRFLMEQAGYETIIVDDGLQALRIVEQENPCLILLDVMLPSLDGFTVCQKIRGNPAYQDIKIVMLTAKGRDTDMEQGLALGADLYVTKPFSTRKLVEDVKALLEEV